MSFRRRPIAAPVGLLFAFSAGMPGFADRDPPSGAGGRPAPHETAGDAPASHRPREDPLARTPGMRVSVGPYVSIQVNVDALGQNIVGDAANEPSIAVSPTNPNNMVIGWRQFDSVTSSFRQAGWAFSFDAGESWTFPGVLTPGTFRSDPVLDSDSSGNFYYQTLTGSLANEVFRSIDGGVSWERPVSAFGGDKNWMVIDKSGGIGDGHIYGTWNWRFGCCGLASLTRSTDGGRSFEPPVVIPFLPQTGTMAVGPFGELYVTGVDGELNATGVFEGAFEGVETFAIDKSTDAQNAAVTPTFSGRDLYLAGSKVLHAPPNPGGLLGQVNVAVDRSAGPSRGNVYVLATVDPIPPGPDPTVIHLVRSTDGGASWSAVIVVNDDPPDNGAWHWFAAHSVAPNGRIDVIWNDTRNSAEATVSELYYAYSYDEGETWSANVPISPRFDSTVGWPNQNKIGDYYTIVSDMTGARVAYAATFNGEQDVYFIRPFPDCNGNGVSDVTDITHGDSRDCNSSFIPDECEDDVGCAAGRVPDGDDVPGEPLRLAKTDREEITLTWEVSCLGEDVDYGVYEGSVGDFPSHTARLCSTNGDTMTNVSPSSGDTYYLIVPSNDTREGSYGTNSEGLQRQVGLWFCAAQQLGDCLAGDTTIR